ncbi:MAG: T9SS type A sorting domain-containing protein [Ignavibacteria bacterium]|nr:T9SS type A sorting domain-containing protein [Ignavibacteria bacterium]
MSFIHLNELGYPTQNLVSYLGKYLIDRYTNTSFNPFLGNSYHIPTHFTETANELQPYFPYESWRDVLNSFIPEVRNKNDFTEDDLYADSYLNISRGCINSLKNYQIEGNQAAYNFLFSVCDSIVNASSYSRNSLLKDPKWEFTPRINSVINVEEDISNRINHFSLEQNYPNPFNPSTMINYQLSMNSNVTLKIYDILGREVATLVNEHKPAGTYTVEWNGTNSAGQQVGSGVYFYQLKTSGGFVETKKMLMIK